MSNWLDDEQRSPGADAPLESEDREQRPDTSTPASTPSGDELTSHPSDTPVIEAGAMTASSDLEREANLAAHDVAPEQPSVDWQAPGATGVPGGAGGAAGQRPPRSRRRNPAAATLAVVAVVSAIIGGVISSMLYPYIGGALGFGAKPYLNTPSKDGTQLQNVAASQTDPPSVYVNQKVGPAVVAVIARQTGVNAWGQRAEATASGTGVIFDSNGYIVTNNHVIENATSITIVLDNNQQVTGRVIGTDPATDLAVIKIDMTGLPVAEFGDSDTLRVGDWAIAIGNPVDPEAFQRTVTQGVISGLNRKIQQGERILTLIQTDAAINPGNSGGPLCNAAGQVIGINVAKIPASENVEGIGLTIPINTARPIINELIQNGRIARAWLGVGVLEKDQAQAYHGVKMTSGLYIEEVKTSSPAAAAGLRSGDIIIKMNDTTIEDYADLRTFLDAQRPGQTVSIVVIRGGGQVTVSAKLTEIPSDLTQ